MSDQDEPLTDEVPRTRPEVKYMDLKEFVDLGYVHEINRLVLHPCGLALEYTVDDNGKVLGITGVWDDRDDPEGNLFGVIDPLKIQSVQLEALRHEAERKRVLGEAGYVEAYDGFVVQERNLTKGEIEPPNATRETHALSVTE